MLTCTLTLDRDDCRDDAIERWLCRDAIERIAVGGDDGLPLPSHGTTAGASAFCPSTIIDAMSPSSTPGEPGGVMSPYPGGLAGLVSPRVPKGRTALTSGVPGVPRWPSSPLPRSYRAV